MRALGTAIQTRAKGVISDSREFAVPSWLQIWHEQEIQIMVLLSFMLQIFLLSAGSLRRRYTIGWLKVMTWLAYVGADLVAVFIIGLFSQYEDGYKLGRPSYGDTLPFLWIPFLLAHLGGQDTITAFSIEDNNLWLRHLLTLIVEVTLAMYVFWKSKDRIDWRLLRIAACIFVTGIIKYGERVLALRGGSRDSLENSSKFTGERPSGQKNGNDNQDSREESGQQNGNDNQDSREESGQQNGNDNQDSIEESRQPNGNDNQDSSEESSALQFVLLVRGLFVGRNLNNLGDGTMTDEIKQKFGAYNSETQPKMIVLELGMMYDLLYTKAMVLHSWTGVIVRCVAFISMWVAFGLFIETEKHAHNRANVVITYALFGGAIFMDICSIIMAIASPWTRAYLENGRFLYRLTSKAWSLFMAKPWSSNSLGQFNLTDSSISEKSTPKWISKVVNAFGLEKHWRNFWHIKHIEDKEIFRYIVESFGRMTTSTLMLSKELKNTLGLPFEHALFRLHIFTDLYISGLERDRITVDEMSLVQLCQKLSNYMIYLMAVHPSMLPVSSAAQDVEPRFAKIVKDYNHTAKLQILKKYTDDMKRIELVPTFTTFEFLAQDGSANSRMKQLDYIKQLWVRLLVYAAGKCRGEVHARQLGVGGELLASVWLFMTHHGFGDVSAEDYNLLAPDDSAGAPTQTPALTDINGHWVQIGGIAALRYAFGFRQTSSTVEMADGDGAQPSDIEDGDGAQSSDIEGGDGAQLSDIEGGTVAQCEKEMCRANEIVQKYEADMIQMRAAQENMQRILQQFEYPAPPRGTSQFPAPPRPFYYGRQPPTPGEPLHGSQSGPPPQGSQPPPPYYYGGPPPADATQGSQPPLQYYGWPPHIYYSYPPASGPAPAPALQGSQPPLQYYGWPSHIYYSYPPASSPALAPAPAPQGSQPPLQYYGWPPHMYYSYPPTSGPGSTPQGSQPPLQYYGWPSHMYYSYPPSSDPAPAPAPQDLASHHVGEESPNLDVDIDLTLRLMPTLPNVESSHSDQPQAKSNKGTLNMRTSRSKKCAMVKISEKEYPMADVARKYEQGKPMVDNPAQLDLACWRLHNYYLDVSNRTSSDNSRSLTVYLKEKYFKHDGEMFVVEYDDLFDMFHFRQLDASILRCFTLHLIDSNMKKEHINDVAFGDPHLISMQSIQHDMAGVRDYIVRLLNEYSTQHSILLPYNTGDHWILIAVLVKCNKVFYLDSLRSSTNHRNEGYDQVMHILDEAFDMYVQQGGAHGEGVPAKLHHDSKFQCRQQPEGSPLCGFYLCYHMLELATNKNFQNLMKATGVMSTAWLNESDVSHIRSQIASFLNEEVICSQGRFNHPA